MLRGIEEKCRAGRVHPADGGALGYFACWAMLSSATLCVPRVDIALRGASAGIRRRRRREGDGEVHPCRRGCATDDAFNVAELDVAMRRRARRARRWVEEVETQMIKG